MKIYKETKQSFETKEKQDALSNSNKVQIAYKIKNLRGKTITKKKAINLAKKETRWKKQ